MTTPPTDPKDRFVDSYLLALLAQASQAISDEFHAVARQHGVSVSEWRVMASLVGSAPISTGRLAQVTLIKQPTLTRLLDRMETAGYVERIPHASDRRVMLVSITQAGAQAVERLIGLAREHELRVLEPFSPASAKALKSTLRQIIQLHVEAPRDAL